MALQLENTGRQKDGRPVWRLLEDFKWSPLEIGFELKIPAGTESDLVALPYLIRPADSDEYREAALIHDYLANQKRYPHIFADTMFLTKLADMDISMVRKLVIRGYLFVRRFLGLS